jgi:hypothetical protein
MDQALVAVLSMTAAAFTAYLAHLAAQSKRSD